MKSYLFFGAFLILFSLAVFGLWKFNKWMRPLETGELDPNANKTENPVYVIRNRIFVIQLVFTWIFTLTTGFLGVWKPITGPLFLSITTLFTILCMISAMKKRYCNICVGSVVSYWGLLCLVAIYKLGYFQFSISFWWLVLGILIYILISLLSLWLFAKGGYKVHYKGEVNHRFPASAMGIALFTYPISRGVIRVLKQNHLGNEVAVPIMMACLLLFVMLALKGVRFIFLDDSKVMGNNDPDL